MFIMNILPQEVTITPYNALCVFVSLACMLIATFLTVAYAARGEVGHACVSLVLLWGTWRVFRAIPLR